MEFAVLMSDRRYPICISHVHGLINNLAGHATNDHITRLIGARNSESPYKFIKFVLCNTTDMRKSNDQLQPASEIALDEVRVLNLVSLGHDVFTGCAAPSLVQDAMDNPPHDLGVFRNEQVIIDNPGVY